MVESHVPRTRPSARRWLLLLAFLLMAGSAAFILVRLWPAPRPPISHPTTAAPLPVLATSARGTATTSATPGGASPLVLQRDWPNLARTFDARAALAEIERLCAPDLAGRRSGSPEGRAAAEYIARRFADLGLQPAGDDGTYLQSFTVPLAKMTQVPSLKLASDTGKQFRARFVDDFMPFATAYSGPGLADGPLVWAGSGSAADLKGANIAGAVAIVLFPPDGDAYRRLDEAGAAGVLVLREDAQAVRMGRVAYQIDHGRAMPVAYVGPDVLSFALAGTSHKLSTLAQRTGVVPLPGRARLEVAMDQESDAPAQNVLAVMPGRSPTLRDEVVILGAHYDHLGQLPNGIYYAGANDNASGVAALLGIARSWQQAGFVPERTVVFAAWDGEEKGLLGARHYVEHPAFPLESTVAMIQLDMVGASPRPLLLIDGEGLVADHALAAATELGVKAVLAEVGRSDHVPFRESGVPASLLIWDALDAPEYHRASDTPSTIDLDLLRQASSLGELVALRLSVAEPVPGEEPAGTPEPTLVK